jgi:uncharacterized cupredoxin-like copper-binding protein
MSRARWLVALGLLGAIAVAIAASLDEPEPGIRTVEIDIHYSRFALSLIRVPAGVPIKFVIVNTDPIDHEWIVGDEAVHERHRTGTEPVHGARPTEQSIPAGTTVETVITFPTAGPLRFICHLPGHEAYGMTGTLIVTGG